MTGPQAPSELRRELAKLRTENAELRAHLARLADFLDTSLGLLESYARSMRKAYEHDLKPKP